MGALRDLCCKEHSRYLIERDSFARYETLFSKRRSYEGSIACNAELACCLCDRALWSTISAHDSSHTAN